MHVWIITVGEPLPTDNGEPRLLRSGALAKYITNQGHKVTWFNSTFDHTHKLHRTNENTTLVHDGISIELLRSTGYSRNLSLKRFVDQAGVAKAFAKRARALPKPDVIMCSLPTLELCKEAITYQNATGTPVIIDIRDLWPDALYLLLPKPLRFFAKVALFWQEYLVRASLRGATGIIGISPKYLAWGLSYAKRSIGPFDAMLPLGYSFPSISDSKLKDAKKTLASIGITSKKRVIWYIGSFGRLYDLEPVIYAAKKLAPQDEGVLFVISGAGDYEEKWRSMAKGLKNLVFTGWITRNEIAALRQIAIIGLQPYVDGAPQGFANKTFEYISSGIPIVSSLMGENADFLNTYKCGLTYNPGDGEDCLKVLNRMLSDDELRIQMACNAELEFRKKYSEPAIFGGVLKVLNKATRYLQHPNR